MDDTTGTQGSAGTTTTTPWDRLPNETPTEYAQFEAYLRMPAPRSACALAKATGLPGRSLDRLRTRNRWAERAAAWDGHKLQQAMQSAPRDVENPYERLLMQAAGRAAALHDAAQLLLGQAHRRMQWAEAAYNRELQKSGAKPEEIEPPVPSPNIVSAIRGASEVMDKCAEAQALALGITDVMKLQAQGSQA